MFQVRSLVVVLLGTALCVVPAHDLLAQQIGESGVVYEAARNKIGLIRYCRNNKLLDSATADRAVAAVESGLRKPSLADAGGREQGDRAQRAGEDGFWEAGRRRNIAGVAKMFGTTPADLCQEWADETLRAQSPRRRDAATAGAGESVQPEPQARPAQAATPPAGGIAARKAARPAPHPPMPEKAALLPARTDPALQRTVPTSARLGPAAGSVISGQANAAISPQASAAQTARQSTPIAARLPRPAADPFPREPSAYAAPPPRPRSEPSPLWGMWPFKRQEAGDDCLMPRCKW